MLKGEEHMITITDIEYSHLVECKVRLEMLKKFVYDEDEETYKNGYTRASLDTSFLRNILGMAGYDKREM